MTEQQLIDDLKATFPGIHARPIRAYGLPQYTDGVWIGGESCMPDGRRIFTDLATWDQDTYNGYVHEAFDAWIEQRGYCLECYDVGVFFALPEDAFNA